MSTVTGTEPLPKLRLVDRCELLGRYESAAFEQPQYLIRRAGDRLVRSSEVLYLLASHLDGSKDAGEIAEQISADLGRLVSAENVCYLVKHKLQPNASVAGTGAVSAQQPRARPLLALRFRAKLLPERAHRGVTLALRPLLWPPAVVTVPVGLFGLDVWLFATRGTALFGLTRQVIAHSFQFLLLTVLVMAACVFHEFAARQRGPLRRCPARDHRRWPLSGLPSLLHRRHRQLSTGPPWAPPHRPRRRPLQRNRCRGRRRGVLCHRSQARQAEMQVPLGAVPR